MSSFIQHISHEAQYTSYPVAPTFASHFKEIRIFSVQQCPLGGIDQHVGRKMSNFQLFYSDQAAGGSPTGPDPENRVGGQNNGCPCRRVFSGLQVPGEPVQYLARTKLPW